MTKRKHIFKMGSDYDPQPMDVINSPSMGGGRNMWLWVIGALNITMKKVTLDVRSNATMSIKVQIYNI